MYVVHNKDHIHHLILGLDLIHDCNFGLDLIHDCNFGEILKLELLYT
jgi:hypothetical protein